MLKNFKMIFLVLAVCVIQSSYGSNGRQAFLSDLRKQFQVEINNIERFGDSGEKKDIFLIKVFEHLVPLPNRYVLITAAQCEKELNSFGEAIGFISVGEISSDGFHISEKDYEALDFSGHSMDVVIYRSKVNAAGSEQIVVSDNDMYLMIQDENPKLWKAMLRAAKAVPMPKGAEFLNQ